MSEYANRKDRGKLVGMVFGTQALRLIVGPLVALALLEDITDSTSPSRIRPLRVADAASQYIPARQHAVLILRAVLRRRVAEAADLAARSYSRATRRPGIPDRRGAW